MNSAKVKHLQGMVSALATEMASELQHLGDVIEEFTLPNEGRTDAPTALALGDTVRVYAAYAGGDDNASLLGDVAIISDVPDPGSIGFIYEIEVQKGPSRRKRFRVLAQQCVLVNASQNDQEKESL